MADLKISEMASAAQINNSDNIELSQGDSVNGYVSLKTNILALAQKIATAINFTSDLQTVNKTLTGAINEAAASGGTDTIAEDFDDTATYNVGEYCIYGGKLYKCTTAVTTAGAWNANDWDETLVMDEVSSGGGGGGYTEVTGTLTAGLTSITLSDASITTNSTIEPFTDKFGVSPTDMTISTGSVTLTFPVQSENLNVKVRVS